MDTQKSHDSINEGPSLTTEGPPQTNVVHIPLSHLGQNLSMISNYNYTPYLCHPSCSFALLHQLAYFCVVIVAFEGTHWWLLSLFLLLSARVLKIIHESHISTQLHVHNSFFFSREKKGVVFGRSCLPLPCLFK